MKLLTAILAHQVIVDKGHYVIVDPQPAIVLPPDLEASLRAGKGVGFEAEYELYLALEQGEPGPHLLGVFVQIPDFGSGNITRKQFDWPGDTPIVEAAVSLGDIRLYVAPPKEQSDGPKVILKLLLDGEPFTEIPLSVRFRT